MLLLGSVPHKYIPYNPRDHVLTNTCKEISRRCYEGENLKVLNDPQQSILYNFGKYRDDVDDGAVQVIPLIDMTPNDGMFNLPARLVTGTAFWVETGAIRIRPAGTNENAL